MRTPAVVPALIALCLVASSSCSDTAAPTPGPLVASQAPLTTLDGVVHLSSAKLNGIFLTLGDGQEVALDGADAGMLATVENADVEVRGAWSADTFIVHDFLVRRVDGADVLDGILIVFNGGEMPDDTTGYGLSLTRGSVVPLIDPPADLTAHVGERVWVAASADGETSAFGVIGR